MKYRKIIIIVFVLIVCFSSNTFSQVEDADTVLNKTRLKNQKTNEIKIPLNMNTELLAQNNVDEKEKTMNIIQPNTSLPGKNAETDKSSFTTDLFYVLGTVAAAAIVYFFWPEKNSEPVKTVTFGKPVHP